MAAVIARFYVSSIELFTWGTTVKLSVVTKGNEENAEFFALAANHVTRLAEAAIRLADMVKSRCYCEDLRYHGNNGPCSCCKLLTEIERESP